MTEDHGHHEANKDSVQCCIIEGTGITRTDDKVEDSTDTKPDESAKEANGDIAG
ncbi:MAG TPA: hypothetical protein VFQ23_04665 [Anaerolineales bacterium]|nr:hypothetical protein [Anaerolineales bacterium]